MNHDLFSLQIVKRLYVTNSFHLLTYLFFIFIFQRLSAIFYIRQSLSIFKKAAKFTNPFYFSSYIFYDPNKCRSALKKKS